MSNIIDNLGFVIIAIIGLFLLISFVITLLQDWIERKVKKAYNKGINDAFKTIEKPVQDLLMPQSKDYLKHKNQYCDDKNKQLEEWILQERFVDDLQKMKNKADDFANRLEMQSTERDSKEFQRKLKVVK